MQKTWVQSLGWEDPLEEGMATPSSILAWRIPMDRGAWWVTVHGIAESDTTEQLTLSFTKSQHWVNQAAECHGRVGSRLRPLLLEISSSSHGAREPSPWSSWAGRGRAGMRELLMGGRSFGWPCARAPRVTGPVPKSQAGTSLVLWFLCPYGDIQHTPSPGPLLTAILHGCYSCAHSVDEKIEVLGD